MNAIRLHEFGPPENLRYEEVDDPDPGPGQVRIAVGAAGVHLIDTVIRSGRAMGPLPLPDPPAIPGREVAGAVDALGPGVEESWLGRRVVAHLGPASRGYAELAVRETDALLPLAVLRPGLRRGDLQEPLRPVPGPGAPRPWGSRPPRRARNATGCSARATTYACTAGTSVSGWRSPASPCASTATSSASTTNR